MADDKCGKEGCSEFSQMGLPPCRHCKRCFCVKHRLPEVHGCGDSAQAKALVDASMKAIEVKQAKKEHDHADSKAKLDAKRAELAKAREKKPSAKATGKKK